MTKPTAEKIVNGKSTTITVRVKLSLYKKIAASADANYRTVSREVVLMACKGMGLDPKDYL
jgi:hypothetical protein